MLGIGWMEALVIAMAVVIFVHPKDLPDFIRTIAGFVRQIRSLGKEFTDIVNNELGGTKKFIKDINGEIQQTFEVPEALDNPFANKKKDKGKKPEDKNG